VAGSGSDAGADAGGSQLQALVGRGLAPRHAPRPGPSSSAHPWLLRHPTSAALLVWRAPGTTQGARSAATRDTRWNRGGRWWHPMAAGDVLLSGPLLTSRSTASSREHSLCRTALTPLCHELPQQNARLVLAHSQSTDPVHSTPTRSDRRHRCP
jgi:hypothetical protein